MADFNTHGGYFAPDDYTRINTGGSHEENPNGGVQLGVDPEGNPNLLEEGEPVYKDYVYSDNITAEEEFLTQNNLPKKYAGKLYSKIADDLFSEAEERPMDPISRNGLEALLGRLADAQEGQKQAKEQKELEEELANLSPEELDQLEMMLSAGAQGPTGYPGDAGVEVPLEEPVAGPAEPMPVEGMPPMMTNGGYLHTYALGGDTDDDPAKRAAEAMAAAQRRKEAQQERVMTLAEIEAENRKRELEQKNRERTLKSYERQLKRNEKALDRLIKGAENVYPADRERYKGLLEKQYKLVDYSKKKLSDFREQYNSKSIDLLPYPEEEAEGELMFEDEAQGSFVLPSGGTSKAYALGGSLNTYPEGGWLDFYDYMDTYGYSKNPSRIAGKYAIDRNINSNFWNGQSARQIEADPRYAAWTEYVATHPNDPNVLRYFGKLDSLVAPGVAHLLDSDGTLADGWEGMFRHRRTDGDLGIYHLTPDFDYAAPADEVPDTAVAVANAPVDNSPKSIITKTLLELAKEGKLAAPATQPTTESVKPAGVSIVAETNPVTRNTKTSPALLPTWPRYAGAIGSGLLGMYDLFQEPDHYTVQRIAPYTPEGHIHLQNEVYNPVDQNMIMNAQITQGNATNRGLRNSGLGASTAAAMLAADNNLTNNLGTGFLQTWDANNQRRNQVVAANNQAEAQRAQFDYGVDSARKAALRDAAVRNIQNDLLLQRLNNEAESEKYAAVSNQINAGLEALSNIGRENVAWNQINTNPYFIGYGYGDKRGGIGYYPYRSCGGKIKKSKK